MLARLWEPKTSQRRPSFIRPQTEAMAVGIRFQLRPGQLLFITPGFFLRFSIPGTRTLCWLEMYSGTKAHPIPSLTS